MLIPVASVGIGESFYVDPNGYVLLKSNTKYIGGSGVHDEDNNTFKVVGQIHPLKSVLDDELKAQIPSQFVRMNYNLIHRSYSTLIDHMQTVIAEHEKKTDSIEQKVQSAPVFQKEAGRHGLLKYTK